jgi:hypothetical protein
MPAHLALIFYYYGLPFNFFFKKYNKQQVINRHPQCLNLQPLAFHACQPTNLQLKFIMK